MYTLERSATRERCDREEGGGDRLAVRSSRFPPHSTSCANNYYGNDAVLEVLTWLRSTTMQLGHIIFWPMQRDVMGRTTTAKEPQPKLCLALQSLEKPMGDSIQQGFFLVGSALKMESMAALKSWP